MPVHVPGIPCPEPVDARGGVDAVGVGQVRGGEPGVERRGVVGLAAADAEGRGTVEAYELALRRELDEEVEVGSPGQMTRLGLINDDSTPVGQVHLGVVHVFELEETLVAPREEGLAEAEFRSLADVVALRSEFETWSQIFIDSVLRTS